jgi:hypothetical protein
VCPPGRRRKSGLREANGRLKRISAAEKRAGTVEKMTVLCQPHRRNLNGDGLSQLAESPLGRLILKHGLRHELFDSGVEYGNVARFYLSAKARRVDINDGPGKGGEISSAKAALLEKELFRLERDLQKHPGFGALRMLCIFERSIPTEAEQSVIGPLYALGRLLGHLGTRNRQGDGIAFAAAADGLGVSARHAARQEFR